MFGVNTQNDAPTQQVTHYLVNFTGLGAPAQAQTIALELGKAMTAAGVDLLAAHTYISPLGADPHKMGLRENWDAISEADREELELRFPELCAALDVLTARGVPDFTAGAGRPDA